MMNSNAHILSVNLVTDLSARYYRKKKNKKHLDK